MSETFQTAVQEVATLSEVDQESIGRSMLSHVEKLAQLRTEIKRGIVSLDVKKGKPLSLETFLSLARMRYAKA